MTSIISRAAIGRPASLSTVATGLRSSRQVGIANVIDLPSNVYGGLPIARVPLPAG